MKEFTNYLNLFGLKKLEPIILASLANEQPMLLIGKHGSAKSFLLERLSKTLDLNYKFYNASLIDYDDLVGIPVPSKDNTHLEYISSKTSIWDAEVVFIDEINRTKPELQNKIFPIIYEKRVQGIDLKDLKYRFAAMNPSYDDTSDYFGTMPLDNALADRFGFIVDVPCWDELSKEDKERTLNSSYESIDYVSANKLLTKLISKTKDLFNKFKDLMSEEINTLMINLMPLLTSKFGYISTRRALVIKDNILAVYAASLALKEVYESEEEVELKDSIFLAVANSLPQKANEYVSLEVLYKAIKTVTDSIDFDAITKEFLLMTDKEKKIYYGFKNIDKIGKQTVFEALPTALSEIEPPLQGIMAYLLTKKIAKYKECPAHIAETLIDLGDRYYNYRPFVPPAKEYTLDQSKVELKKHLELKTTPGLDRVREKVLTIVDFSSYNVDLKEVLNSCDNFLIRAYKELELDE